MEYNSTMFDQMSQGQSIAYCVVMIALAVFSIVVNWKLFEKAGEPGWKSLIPIYNIYILFKIADGQGWKFLLLLIPIVNIVISILLYVRLAYAFGKPGVFAVGLIFVPVIFEAILAFGDAEYIGPRGEYA